MLSLLFAIYLLAFKLGTCNVLGVSCEIESLQSCLENFSEYEGKLPLFGGTAEELDHTCDRIGESLKCIEAFSEDCKDSPSCDKKCKIMIEAIQGQSEGISKLHNKLCVEEDPFRNEFLQHYQCFESAGAKYELCHNKSQESHEFINLNLEPKERVIARCCAFSWFQSCLTNATFETCGENSTFFVSEIIHMMIGINFDDKCNHLPYCSEPPLPNSDFYENSDRESTEETGSSKASGIDALRFSSVLLFSLFFSVFKTVKLIE